MTQVTGSFTAVGQTLAIQPGGQSNINVHWAGTFTGLSIVFEVSADGSSWSYAYCQNSTTGGNNYQTSTHDSTISPRAAWSLLKSTHTYFRARCAALASGQADLTIESLGPGEDAVDAVQIQGETQQQFSISSTGAQAGSGVAAAGVYDFSSDVDCFLKIAAAAGTASDVTVSTGEPLYAGNVVPHRLAANDRPGAITAGASGTLRYIRTHA